MLISHRIKYRACASLWTGTERVLGIGHEASDLMEMHVLEDVKRSLICPKRLRVHHLRARTEVGRERALVSRPDRELPLDRPSIHSPTKQGNEMVKRDFVAAM